MLLYNHKKCGSQESFQNVSLHNLGQDSSSMIQIESLLLQSCSDKPQEQRFRALIARLLTEQPFRPSSNVDKITHAEEPEYNFNSFCVQDYHAEGVGSVLWPWGKFKLRCLCNNRDLHTPVTG